MPTENNFSSNYPTENPYEMSPDKQIKSCDYTKLVICNSSM